MTSPSTMRLPGLIYRYRPLAPVAPVAPVQLAPWRRLARFQAFEAAFDPADLAEARRWRQGASEASLPRGTTTFARSSGPGGQHVNKTESKAITSWTVSELTAVLPKLMHAPLRESKHYVRNKDSLAFQAQTSRDRDANVAENRAKLLEELHRMYSDAVPGDTSAEKRRKHQGLERSSREARLKSKKFQSSKKQARRGDF